MKGMRELSLFKDIQNLSDEELKERLETIRIRRKSGYDMSTSHREKRNVIYGLDQVDPEDLPKLLEELANLIGGENLETLDEEA